MRPDWIIYSSLLLFSTDHKPAQLLRSDVSLNWQDIIPARIEIVLANSKFSPFVDNPEPESSMAIE